MQAIQCKYLPATNHLPSRVKAFCEAGSVTVCYHGYSNEFDCPYHSAVHELCNKLGWEGELIGGSLKNGDRVYVFTAVDVRQRVYVEQKPAEVNASE